MEPVQQQKQNKTYDPKQQAKEKTFKHKIMLDTVQPEQQNKTNDSETTTKRENIQAEVNDVYSATRVAEQNK